MEQAHRGAASRRRRQDTRDYERVESLDYDEGEHEARAAAMGEATDADDPHRRRRDTLLNAAVRWLLCLVTGVTVAHAAFVVNMGVENIAAYKISATFALLPYSYAASFLVYAGANCALVALAAALVNYAAPAAAGSGIPEVKAFLNGVDVPGVLLARTLLAKIVGCIFSVAAGLAVGKEGPFVHIGSAIACLLGQGGTKRWRLNWSRLDAVRTDTHLRELVTCGACAGVAAAFRAPVGGVLFALEETSSWWSHRLLWRAFFTTAVVSVVVRSSAKLCAGKSCGYFGSGGFIIFEMREGQVDYELFELVPMGMLGLLGGLLGASFNAASASLITLRSQLLPPDARFRVGEAVAVAFITSVVSYGVPLVAGCEPCPTDSVEECPRPEAAAHYGNYVGFNCQQPATYNPLATLFLNTQDNAIRALLLSNTDHEFSLPSLISFFLLFYGLAIVTTGVAVPSGLFVPCILCGASYGRAVGFLMTEIYPVKDIDEGTYALLGAASFLGGAMRVPVSLCVILLELTNNLNLLPLMMLVLLTAKAVGDATGVEAVYDLHVALKGLPVLPERPPLAMHRLTAADAAATHVVCFNRVERVRDVLATLMSNQHSGFPVLQKPHRDDPEGSAPSLMGMVLRSHLLALLQSPRCAVALQPSPHAPPAAVHDPQVEAEVAAMVAAGAKAVSTRGLQAADCAVDPNLMDRYLDLSLLARSCPHVVQETASLAQAFTLFRQLGLRHLPVVRRPPEVVGLLTRKDLLQAPEGDEATAKLRASAILGFSPLQRAAAERKPAYWYSALI